MADTGPHTTNSRILIVVCVLIAIWLVLPLFIIVPISFSGENSFSFPPKTWTLARYASLANPVWISALVNSLTIAVVVAILSSVLGTLAAFGIVRSHSKLMALVRAMILSPQVVPIVVFGLGLYLVFLRWNLVGTFWGFVIAHTVLAVPFVVIPVSAALQTLDRSLRIVCGDVPFTIAMGQGPSLRLAEGWYCPRFGVRERSTVVVLESRGSHTQFRFAVGPGHDLEFNSAGDVAIAGGRTYAA